MKLIKCYYPPINITHLGDYILVQSEDVHKYTKELYEKGIGHKVIPPQNEYELQEFFRWKIRYKSVNLVFRYIIDFLMAL